MVQTPLEKIETLKHESFRGSTLYKQQELLWVTTLHVCVGPSHETASFDVK